MDDPRRKPTRMRNDDYGRIGAYFITICTNNRDLLFGDFLTDGCDAARMVERVFLETIHRYPNASCPKHVVMPNHLHAIIVIERADTGSAPTTTIPRIIQTFKRISTGEYTKLVNQGMVPSFYEQVCQRSYYDHIIRNEQEFKQICIYIDDNPRKWRENPGEV